MRAILLLLLLPATGACADMAATTPSLAPRTAEAIDPRIAVEAEPSNAPVNSTLAARLAMLIDAAARSEGGFGPSMARAEQLAQSAGPSGSEGWVRAHQALSVAVAARAAVPAALADIDALAASAIGGSGLAPGDRTAIEAAASRVAQIDRAQRAQIEAVEAQLRR